MKSVDTQTQTIITTFGFIQKHYYCNNKTFEFQKSN